MNMLNYGGSGHGDQGMGTKSYYIHRCEHMQTVFGKNWIGVRGPL